DLMSNRQSVTAMPLPNSFWDAWVFNLPCPHDLTVTGGAFSLSGVTIACAPFPVMSMFNCFTNVLDIVFWFDGTCQHQLCIDVLKLWVAASALIEDKDELHSSAVEGIDVEVLDGGGYVASLGEIAGMVHYNKRGMKCTRKLTSPVWFHFEMLPLGDDERQKSKCKKCGKVYLAETRCGTCNLKHHLEKCLEKDTLDVDLQPLPGSSGSMSPSMSKLS
ncbi:Zinc finger, BED-type, partial [Dillenia turbinata]